MNNRNIPEEKILASAQYPSEESYWLERLGGELPHSGFTFPVKVGERRLEEFPFTLSNEVGARLAFMANKSPQRLYMILIAGMSALMHRYRRDDGGKFDIVLGSVTPRPKSREVDVSKLLNTLLALRIKEENAAGLTFKQLLMAVRETVTGAVKNQAYPLEVLPGRPGFSFTPEEFDGFFDVMVLLDSLHDERFIDAAHAAPNFVVMFKEDGDTVSGRIRFNAQMYHEQEIKSIVSNFEHLLKTALFETETPLVQIGILPEPQLRRLVEDYNDSAAQYPREQTIHRMFEECVEKFPERTAVVDPEQGDISYDRLNKAANRIAHQLHDNGVTPGTPAALVMEPSFEMIASILGVLKAGGGYLPLDPKHPDSRINSILDDCKPPVVLTQENVLKQHAYTSFQGLRHTVHQPLLTAPCPQVPVMDDLPLPDRGLVDYNKYNLYIGQAMVKHCMALQGSRGCPYNCAYCHKIWPKKQVMRSAENIFEEVKLYYDMGVRRFAVIDDIFNLDINTSSAFFREIIDHKMDVQLFFPNGLRGDIMTKEYIDLMVEAGTVNVALALETASLRLQKLVKKNLNLDKFEANLGYFIEKHPQVILELFTMHGFPTETEEEAMMTLDFIRRQKWLHFPYVHILKIFPNTDMAALAIENGVSPQAIADSADLAFHELPDTLPFDKKFTLNYQASFLNEYFLNKDRLRHVLPLQMKSLTHDELVEKYDSYLPADIRSFEELLDFTGISTDEVGSTEFFDESTVAVPDLDQKIKAYFPQSPPGDDAMRVLLLDLSQHFSHEEGMLYDVVEPPLGLMYVMTYLNREFGGRIHGKVAKARIDFNNYSQLKELIEGYRPDVIGIRALSFYKDNVHRTAAQIRQWGINVPIVAGGPYATSDFQSMLQDPNIDLAVIGEGELITTRLIGAMLDNDRTLPYEDTLRKIPGLAFIPGVCEPGHRHNRSSRAVMVVNPDVTENALLPATNPEPSAKAEDLAYIIFTSGSTGKPKGVMIEHRNVVRLMTNDRYPFQFSQDDVWTLFHSYCFDFSVWEMYGALLYGGKLIVFPRTLSRDTEAFIQLLKEQGVTVLNQTPSAFYQLAQIEAMAEATPDLDLRYVIFGGEALNPARLKEFHARYPQTVLVNMFGITETTVHVTFKAIGKQDIESGASNIGKPIPTLQTYILDSKGRLLPPGVPGEIYVGGDGVARGYVNQVEMTAGRFLVKDLHGLFGHGLHGLTRISTEGFINKENGIISPFINHQSSITNLYKSGDLGRWLVNGDLEYLGRIDQQVQVRGFRVELGEIESRLMSHNGVKAAAVIAGMAGESGGDIFLCGYVVPDPGSGWGTDNAEAADELKNYLGRWLPEYMVPAYIILLDKMPLTVNGKLDRKALPDPKKVQTGSGDAVAPRDEVEKKLAAIWQEVLELKDRAIGINENFFDLGGHSLKATILAAKIHKVFDVKIPLADLFRDPEIEAVAAYIRQSEKEAYTAIEPCGILDNYPLSPAQKRLFFVQQSHPEATGYNIFMALKIEGQLDPANIEGVFKVLIERHDSFRTSFHVIEGRPVQVVHPAIDNFELEHIEQPGTGDREIPAAVDRFIRPFDLSLAPLFRVGLIQVNESVHILLLDIHHIVADGYSMITLIKEFTALYQKLELPQITLQYKDYTHWLQRESGSELYKKQEAFWLEQFAGDIPQLSIPTDFARTGDASGAGGHISFRLDKDLTGRIYELTRKEDVTLFTFLLSAYTLLLSKLSGQDDILAGTITHGRRHTDLEAIVGMFVNTLVLRNFPQGNLSFRDYLHRVGERTIQAFDNQDFQFDDLVDALNLPRIPGRNPLFDVMFELQNIDTPDLDIPGLSVQLYPHRVDSVKFDLTCICTETDGEIDVEISFNKRLFKQETIETIGGFFRDILSIVLADPGTLLSRIEFAGRKKEVVRDSFNEDLEDE